MRSFHPPSALPLFLSIFLTSTKAFVSPSIIFAHCTMKSFSLIVAQALTIGLLTASNILSTAAPPNHLAEAAAPLPENDIIQELFNTREPKAFADLIIKAKELKVNQQIILEATFLYHVDLAEYDKIVTLTEKFSLAKKDFDPNISQIFSTTEDWSSVIEYGLALKALKANNIPLFKKHIQEAFWLSPSKGAAFAPHINQLHTQNAMKGIQLKHELSFFQVNAKDDISLASMLENKKALIFRFWSPWSQNIEANLPLTKHLAEQCKQHNISFASILISRDAQGITDNLQVIEELKNTLPSYWLADSEESTMTKKLRVTDLPTIVIISTDGKILYNGTLQEPQLWQTLKTIAPEIKAIPAL